MNFYSSFLELDLIRGGSDGKLGVTKGVFTEGLESRFTGGVETGAGVVIESECIDINVLAKIGG